MIILREVSLHEHMARHHPQYSTIERHDGSLGWKSRAVQPQRTCGKWSSGILATERKSEGFVPIEFRDKPAQMQRSHAADRPHMVAHISPLPSLYTQKLHLISKWRLFLTTTAFLFLVSQTRLKLCMISHLIVTKSHRQKDATHLIPTASASLIGHIMQLYLHIINQ